MADSDRLAVTAAGDVETHVDMPGMASPTESPRARPNRSPGRIASPMGTTTTNSSATESPGSARASSRRSSSIPRPHSKPSSQPADHESPVVVDAPAELSGLGSVAAHTNRLLHRTQIRQGLQKFYAKSKNVQRLKTFPLDEDVRCMGVVAEEQVWVASRDGSIHVRNAALGDKIAIIRAHRPDSRVKEKFQVNAIYTDQLAGKVWVGASDSLIRVYDMGTRKMRHELTDHSGGIKSIVGADNAVWTASEDFTIFQRSVLDGTTVKQLVGHTSWVHAMVVDPGTGQLWSSSKDGIRIWNTEIADSVPAPKGRHGRQSSQPNVSGLGHSRASLSRSSTSSNASALIQEAGFASSDCLALLKGHDDTVLTLLVVGDMIWSGGADKMICVWNPATRSLVKKFQAHKHWVHCMRMVDSDVWTASFGEIFVWDPETYAKIRKVELPDSSKVADIAATKGRVWVGCRQKASLHMYRVYEQKGASHHVQRVARSSAAVTGYARTTPQHSASEESIEAVGSTDNFLESNDKLSTGSSDMPSSPLTSPAAQRKSASPQKKEKGFFTPKGSHVTVSKVSGLQKPTPVPALALKDVGGKSSGIGSSRSPSGNLSGRSSKSTASSNGVSRTPVRKSGIRPPSGIPTPGSTGGGSGVRKSLTRSSTSAMPRSDSRNSIRSDDGRSGTVEKGFYRSTSSASLSAKKPPRAATSAVSSRLARPGTKPTPSKTPTKTTRPASAAGSSSPSKVSPGDAKRALHRRQESVLRVSKEISQDLAQDVAERSWDFKDPVSEADAEQARAVAESAGGNIDLLKEKLSTLSHQQLLNLAAETQAALAEQKVANENEQTEKVVLAAKLDDKIKEVENLERDLEEMKTDHDREIAELNKQVQENTDTKQDLEAAQARILKLEGQLKVTKTTLASTSNDKLELNHRVKQLMEELERAHANAGDDLAETALLAEKERAAKNAEILDLSQKLAAKDEEIENMREDRDREKDKCNAIDMKHQTLKSQVQALEQDKQSLQEQVASLTKSLERQERQALEHIQELKEEVDSRTQENKSLLDRVRSMKDAAAAAAIDSAVLPAAARTPAVSPAKDSRLGSPGTTSHDADSLADTSAAEDAESELEQVELAVGSADEEHNDVDEQEVEPEAEVGAPVDHFDDEDEDDGVYIDEEEEEEDDGEPQSF